MATVPLSKMYPTMFPPEAPADPAAPYGLRPDGNPKGKGYLGELKRPDGGVMTEYSVGVELDGQERDIPTIVPTLTQKEIDHLLNMNDGDKIPKSIIDKAVQHAEKRIADGKDVFAGSDESPAEKK
jgi:hypothetical protein